MVRGADGAFCEGFIADLGERGGFAVGVQEDVRVGVHQAGEHGKATQVNRGGCDLSWKGGCAFVDFCYEAC